MGLGGKCPPAAARKNHRRHYPKDIIKMINKWKSAVIELDNMLLADAQKEFSETVQAGYGIDCNSPKKPPISQRPRHLRDKRRRRRNQTAHRRKIPAGR